MLDDLRRLMDTTAPRTSYDGYRIAIMEENVLGKGTASTRLWSWKKLRELYGLNSELPIFRCLRQLWDADSEGRPVLAILCACARDPLLRLSAATILKAPERTALGPGDFSLTIAEAAPDRFSATNLKAIGNRICSSWAQSGHLRGKKVRRRSRPLITPETTAYALVLARLAGARGPLLFSSFWTALLDAPTDRLFEFAEAASQRGWIDLRRAGSVVDVGFSKLLTPEEEEALREPD